MLTTMTQYTPLPLTALRDILAYPSLDPLVTPKGIMFDSILSGCTALCYSKWTGVFYALPTSPTGHNQWAVELGAVLIIRSLRRSLSPFTTLLRTLWRGEVIPAHATITERPR